METIKIEQLSKTYTLRNGRQITALEPLSMTIGEGEVFGLLGPNGAGKTTLVKLLLGITPPTSGSASVMGRPVPSVDARRVVGFLPENHRYPPHLTGEQTLMFYGNLSGMSGAPLRKRAHELLDRLSLLDRRKQRVRQYSKGMLQRLGLAQALLNTPKVLFLDEPTDGIDPRGRKEIRDLLLEQKQSGTTIFLNSHLLSEVELITDRVAILDKGQVVKTGTTRELTESRGFHLVTLDVWPERIEPFPGLVAVDPAQKTLEVQAADATELNRAIDELRRQSLLIVAVLPKRSSLEELFLSLVSEHSQP